jgi:hypothetical protein
MLALVLSVALAAAKAPPPADSALERLAQEVGRAIAAKHFEPPVGIYVEGAPAPLERAFASLLASRLAGAHLAPVVIDAKDASEAEQIARARGVRSLARLTLEVKEARLTARGDALSTWVNFWSGATPTRSGPALALTGSTEVDAQARALAELPPAAAPPLTLALAPLVRLPEVPAAIALGDLNGDQRDEVLVLSGDQLLAYDAQGRELWHAALQQPDATRPCRDPFGLVSVVAGKVLAWSARRERPELFSLSGKPLGAADGLTLDTIALRADPGFNRFLPEVTWAGKAVTLPAALQAVSVFGALALVVYPDGTASLPRGAAPTARLVGVGSGSALADLDGDGTPELVLSSTRTVGVEDEVRVLTLAEADALAARQGLVVEASPAWQQPLAGRALVAASGDLDGDGADETVLGTWLSDGAGELVILKRVTP